MSPVITSIFLLDSCMFLLEAIGVNNSRPFHFEAHLILVQKLIPLNIAICVLPFEQLAKRSANRLQESNLKRLQDRSFISILFYLPSNSH